MKISIKVFFVILVFLSAGQIGLAQIESVQNDTLKVKKTESITDSKEKNKKASDNKQTGKIENNAGSIKQVKSARPDMSKARGARPPDIIRPSGSRIPKGVGRPAGAVRPGRG